MRPAKVNPNALAIAIASQGKPAFLYYLGDHDPSGIDIPRAVSAGLREFAPEADIRFKRIAVTEKQIAEFSLPTRPTKKTDSRSKSFDGESVEVDAIPAAELRRIVRKCIERHVDKNMLNRTKRIENELLVTDEIIAIAQPGTKTRAARYRYIAAEPAKTGSNCLPISAAQR